MFQGLAVVVVVVFVGARVDDVGTISMDIGLGVTLFGAADASTRWRLEVLVVELSTEVVKVVDAGG